MIWRRRWFFVRCPGRRFGLWHQKMHQGDAFVSMDLRGRRVGFWYKTTRSKEWPA